MSRNDGNRALRMNEIEPLTVSDLPAEVAGDETRERLAEVEIPESLKDPVPVAELEHRRFEDGEFWRRVPAYADVDEDTFLDPAFQLRHSVAGADDLRAAVSGLADEAFLDDVARGLAEAPMTVRVSPYLIGLVDWENPYEDPIRIQFLPTASTRRPEHPRLSLDSLHEQDDSPTPGLVHRYPDKALFLPLDVCPVYCRYCTRSYAVGADTDSVEKEGFKPRTSDWEAAFAYLASRPEIEDVVVSGGDAYMLPARRLRQIGDTLLDIPHVRRIRIASKGPAVMPMKLLRDEAWTDALTGLCDAGRERGKEVCLHTHFNSTHEITEYTRLALDRLFRRGVKVRNQSVLIRGVNDDPDEMVNLVKQLSWMNVQPYYVYQHDMVKGVEDLRTRLEESMEVERYVRGSTAGFNTPTFVTDVPGGGGKRDLHSFDFYDETTGVAVYRSPAVDEDKYYLYFDPLHLLPEEGRRRWADPAEHDRMVKEAVLAAGVGDLDPAD